jgi:hypothetical protein
MVLPQAAPGQTEDGRVRWSCFETASELIPTTALTHTQRRGSCAAHTGPYPSGLSRLIYNEATPRRGPIRIVLGAKKPVPEVLIRNGLSRWLPIFDCSMTLRVARRRNRPMAIARGGDARRDAPTRSAGTLPVLREKLASGLY